MQSRFQWKALVYKLYIYGKRKVSVVRGKFVRPEDLAPTAQDSTGLLTNTFTLLKNGH